MVEEADKNRVNKNITVINVIVKINSIGAEGFGELGSESSFFRERSKTAFLGLGTLYLADPYGQEASLGSRRLRGRTAPSPLKVLTWEVITSRQWLTRSQRKALQVAKDTLFTSKGNHRQRQRLATPRWVFKLPRPFQNWPPLVPALSAFLYQLHKVLSR